MGNHNSKIAGHEEAAGRYTKIAGDEEAAGRYSSKRPRMASVRRAMLAPVTMPMRSAPVEAGSRRIRFTTTTPVIGSCSVSATAYGGSSVVPRWRTMGAQNGDALDRSL